MKLLDENQATNSSVNSCSTEAIASLHGGLSRILAISDFFLEAPPPSDPSLGSGLALHALVHHIAGRSSDARRVLRDSFAMLDSRPLSASMYRGILGPAWLAGVIGWDEEDKPDLDEMLGDLDALVTDSLEEATDLNIDLINGLAGICIYICTRPVTSHIQERLLDVVGHQIAGVLDKWLYSPTSLQSVAVTNLGMAHGFPGLLASLFCLQRAGALPRQVSEQELLNSAHRLVEYGIETESGLAFPNRIGENGPGRMAWCYGSLGVAGVLLQAAELDQRFLSPAQRCLEFALWQYGSGKHSIRDASLCHGYSGAILLLSHYGQALPFESPLRQTCAESVKDLLGAMPPPVYTKAGLIAYPFHTPKGRVLIRSLLEGAEGVVLAALETEFPGSTPLLALLGYKPALGLRA